MKKVFIIILLSLFSSLSLSVSFAQSTNSAQLKHVEYELPYPGILPDNPLYFLKAIRDNIWKVLITDSLKKADFDLLQSDKRLGAGRLLLLKGKDDLATTTLSKSGNYFDDAIANAFKAKKEGRQANSILNKLLTASIKHQQVLQDMQKGKRGDLLLNLRFLEARARDFQERVEIIKSE